MAAVGRGSCRAAKAPSPVPSNVGGRGDGGRGSGALPVLPSGRPCGGVEANGRAAAGAVAPVEVGRGCLPLNRLPQCRGGTTFLPYLPRRVGRHASHWFSGGRLLVVESHLVHMYLAIARRRGGSSGTEPTQAAAPVLNPPKSRNNTQWSSLL